MKHTIKTVLLLTGLAALFMMIGYFLGGRSGMRFALLISLVMNVGAYWYSDKIVLSMHGAKQIGPGHPSRVYEIVHELCAKIDLPMPKVYITPDHAPNAFATGRNPENSAVAVTQGILRILSERELRGVLAHELGHIRNRDVLVSTVVASIASAIMCLAHMFQWVGIFGSMRGNGGERGINPLALLFTIIVAPLVAALVQMGVSRTREYMADETGAELSGDPESLASALKKISDPRLIKQFQSQENMQDMQPAFAHLYIVNHFSKESVLSWFSTHPPVEKRVSKLMGIKGKLSV